MGCVLETRVDVSACCLPCGNETEENSSCERDTNGEGDDAAIEVELHRLRVPGFCEEVWDEVSTEIADEQTGGTSE